MWVFGYGSLMWDNWEQQFQGTKYNHAVLRGYRREFNKSSTKNWGTPDKPGPTLGLEATPNAMCIGCVFSFEDGYQSDIRNYLTNREGRGFSIVLRSVDHKDIGSVNALTPINKVDHKTYIGHLPLEERARMAKIAVGSTGRCIDYIRNIYQELARLGIDDPYVERMWNAVQQ